MMNYTISRYGENANPRNLIALCVFTSSLVLTPYLTGLYATMQLNLFKFKKCKTCKNLKLLQQFYFCKRDNRYSSECKKCKAQYDKQYRETNKEEIAKKKKQYYQDNKENILEQQKQYRQDHKEEKAEYAKQYGQDHKVEIAEQQKQYRQTNKEKIVNRKKQYYQTEEGKKSHRKANKKWRTKPKGKLAKIRQVTNRRRKLGFNPLNNAFRGSVWHHINDIDVVAIPEEIHIKFQTGETKRHRALVLTYYGTLENMLTDTTLTQRDKENAIYNRAKKIWR